MAKKHQEEASCEFDLERFLTDIQSPDESVRAKAVRRVCPCRMGWEVFEQYMRVVTQMQKDPSPLVRKAALHVFEDSYEMQSSAMPTTPQQFKNDIVATRRRLRGRADGEQENAPMEFKGKAERQERQRSRQNKRAMAAAFRRGGKR
ncbi:MAG TPA: hypothetical protein VFB38_27475 [Chthonomonadaceae bacterium]|nr:hypothetical protein [Chthonomonadaceae bacterium]